MMIVTDWQGFEFTQPLSKAQTLTTVIGEISNTQGLENLRVHVKQISLYPESWEILLLPLAHQ